jgi:flagellar hook protein FlgE
MPVKTKNNANQNKKTNKVETESSDSDNSDNESQSSDKQVEAVLKHLGLNKSDLINVESDDSDDDSNDEKSEESDEEESDEDEKENSKSIKEPKVKKEVEKLNFEKVIKMIEDSRTEFKTVESELIDIHKLLKEKEKQKLDIMKKIMKFVDQLPKLHLDDINTARKEKPKRKNPSRSGILKENPVPPILIKFLNLKEGALLQRPKVMSALNNKFKELGLKHGQDTIMDDKTAKIFGLQTGQKIGFSEFQKFLANIYDDAFPDPEREKKKAERKAKKNNVVL